MGRKRPSWSLEQIREGFERYKAEHGRLPLAPEIDELDYLPPSRFIQRHFGGLEKVRGQLGYTDVHFGRGAYRRGIANRTGIRGRATEISLEKVLRDKFGEVFVHTEKIFDESKNRVDFYIYSPDGNFGVDIFYTETMRDLQKNINLKIDKYSNFPGTLYFVVGNEKFSQNELNDYMTSKTKALGDKTLIVSTERLSELIKSMRVYGNPLAH